MGNENENPFDIVVLLKTCTSMKDLAGGCKLHAYIRDHMFLGQNAYVGSALINMYAKCGTPSMAQRVHKEIPVRTVVTWNTLITAYAQQGQGEEALKCFDDMLHEGHIPSVVTFVCVLKACGVIKAATKGEEIHGKIVSLGMLENHIVLRNTLLDMYVKCGALRRAQRVLEELPHRDVVSWSVLISGYAREGQGEEALKCFDDMLYEGHFPDAVTFVCVLKACGSIGAAVKGKEIHHKIVNLGMLEKDSVLGNAVVDMYAKCGLLAKAQQVLEELPVRDVVSWSALIAGHVQLGQGEDALECFDEMLHEGHSPTVVTFICVLKACGSIKAVAKCEEIHGKIVSLGMLEKDNLLGNTLVSMYVKCGALLKAQQLLKELPIQNVVTWSALIAGYAEQGQGEEALKLFDDMLCEGHSPTAVTFICALKACGTIRAAAKGKEIHDKIASLGMLEKNIVLGSTLVDMYVKCGALTKAQQVLKELPVRNMVTWNAVIAGYVEQRNGEEALKCFDDMLHEGLSPDVVTFVCALKACASIGAAAKGKDIHDKIVSLGMLEKDTVLGTTLMYMYTKCGALEKAQRVLEELPVRDVVSWSILISGYSQQGQSLEALVCFERMLSNKVKPNSTVLSSVLNACSNSGLIVQAETYFSRMIIKYGIHPNLEHYYCMTDLFARAGKFNEALSVIAKMPSDKCSLGWVTLLDACRKWGAVKIGGLAFERAVYLDKKNPAVYVLIADMCTMANMPQESDKIEVTRMTYTAWKNLDVIDGFYATDTVHSVNLKHA